jgi:hypothetical protein
MAGGCSSDAPSQLRWRALAAPMPVLRSSGGGGLAAPTTTPALRSSNGGQLQLRRPPFEAPVVGACSTYRSEHHGDQSLPAMAKLRLRGTVLVAMTLCNVYRRGWDLGQRCAWLFETANWETVRQRAGAWTGASMAKAMKNRCGNWKASTSTAMERNQRKGRDKDRGWRKDGAVVGRGGDAWRTRA